MIKYQILISLYIHKINLKFNFLFHKNFIDKIWEMRNIYIGSFQIQKFHNEHY